LADTDTHPGDASADKIFGGLDNGTIGGAAGDNNLRDKAEDETIYTGPGIDTVTDTFGDNAILIKVYKND
jgi:hypothetical protein